MDGRWLVSGSWDNTVRLWDVATGECLRTLEGHTDYINSVALSANGRWVVSGGNDKTLRLWGLDWEYEFPEPKDWDERARPYLRSFLVLNTVIASTDPTSPDFLKRCGKPVWDELAWQGLLQTLRDAGYGWVNPEGIRRELDDMAANWKTPPAAPWEVA